MSTGKLELLVNNPETGTATEEIPVDFGEETIEIGFNARYLMDISGQVDGETATFKLADAASPTVVQDEDDPRALYVLMPLRV